MCLANPSQIIIELKSYTNIGRSTRPYGQSTPCDQTSIDTKPSSSLQTLHTSVAKLNTIYKLVQTQLKITCDVN